MQLQGEFGEVGLGETLSRAEQRLQLAQGIGGRGHAVELRPIASAEHGELVQTVQRAQLAMQRFQTICRERQFFAHLDRRLVMRGAQDKQRLAHGFTSTGARVWRLELTGPKDTSATANRMMQVHAKRRETSRLFNRRPSATA